MIARVLNKNKFVVQYFYIIYIIITLSIIPIVVIMTINAKELTTLAIILIIVCTIMGLAGPLVIMYFGRGIIDNEEWIESWYKKLNEENIFYKINVLSYTPKFLLFDEQNEEQAYLKRFYVFNDKKLVILDSPDNTLKDIDAEFDIPFVTNSIFNLERRATEILFTDMNIKLIKNKRNRITIHFTLKSDESNKYCVYIKKHYNGYIMETQFAYNQNAYDRFVMLIDNQYKNQNR